MKQDYVHPDAHVAAVSEKWKTRAYIGVALLAGCALLWVLVQIFGVLWQAVATIIVTAVIAFMLHGFVNFLEEKGLSRHLAAALAVGALFAVIAGFFAAFVPVLVEQIAAFSAAAPDYANGAREWIEETLAVLPSEGALASELVVQGTQWVQEQSMIVIQSAADGLFSGAMSVGNALLIFFIALVCAFWTLADLPTISREFMSLFDEEQQGNLRIVANAFSTAVYGWAKATTICAIIVGVLNGVALWLLGVPYCTLLGLLSGVLYFIPYIGSLICAIIVVAAALLVSPIVAAVALVVNLAVNTVVANIVSPKLMESSVNVHPAIILIAILIGGALGGMVGMLFSIPVAAAAQGVFITFYEKRTGKELATENGALFQKPKTKYSPTMRKKQKAPKDDNAG